MFRRLAGLLSLFFPLLALLLLKFYAAQIPSSAALVLKLYPVAVNLALLSSFAFSLLHPPSAIERLARLREPELSPAAIRYTRKVTQVWCGFFVLNAGIALATALWMSNEAWALYNGLIAYIAMGCLFCIEWLIRQKVKRREAA